MRIKTFTLALTLLTFISLNVDAQLSKNPDKFLGNITTRGSVNPDGYEYKSLWNQITGENETKWQSIEGTRHNYSWGNSYWGADAIYKYANDNNILFKFHTLVWGAQYPNWFPDLSVKEKYNAIVEWMDEAKRHYPDLKMIDVVNEAVGMHQQGNPMMKEALGGGGTTGYDWLIKAFELAYERWPNAILIYNDYNTFQNDTQAYLDLVRTLRDAGAPIDAYGCQSHDVTNISVDNLKNSMKTLQDGLKMPMYITELDIDIEDDAQQRSQYEKIFPIMWEAPYCAGVTIWGFIHGSTWVDNSGIIKNGVERPAMTWLRSYMATDNAKTAKSPYPGMKKQISLYIKPATISVTKNDTVPITIRAKMVNSKKTIDSIRFYVNNKLDTVLTTAPYVVKYVPKTTGKYELKAVAFDNDSVTYERYGAFTAHNPRSVYKNDTIKLPGTLQAENYDEGGESVTYHDNESENRGDASFRTGNGVDIVNCTGGRALGYTNTDEWLEYTVDVKKSGYYTYNAVVSSGTTGSGFRLSLNTSDGLVDITENLSVPQTASNDWGTYTTVSGRTLIKLSEGKQIIRLTITGSSCNIDKISFEHIELDESLNLKIKANPDPATVKTDVTLSFTPINAQREKAIKNIKVYVNGKLNKTLTTSPFEYTYRPTSKGTLSITAIATDTLDHQSDIAKYSLKVNNARSAYKSVSLPGTIEAENFDKGGEGLSFHDSDSDDEGSASYRSDNEGVDIVAENGGYAIGYTRESGEWLEYTVNIQTAGKYSIKATVCSGLDNAGFRIGLMNDGSETQLATVSVRNDGWGNYFTTNEIKLSKELPEGPQIIRLTITGVFCNIDKIEFICKESSAISYISEDDLEAPGKRYNLGGAAVGDDYKGIVIIDGKTYLQR